MRGGEKGQQFLDERMDAGLRRRLSYFEKGRGGLSKEGSRKGRENTIKEKKTDLSKGP